jgi:GH35 family endo-1,4-beta-xylanase
MLTSLSPPTSLFFPSLVQLKMKLSLSFLLIAMALTSLVSAKMTTKKHCKRRPKFSPSTQQYLIGHLRKRPDFLHGVSLDRDTAAKVTASGASLACAWEADIYTPTYEMKWGPLEPNKEGVWETKNMDQLARWTRVHRKFMRGHAGVWDQELPDWVKQLDGPQNKKALEKAVYDHVYGVMKRYGHVSVEMSVNSVDLMLTTLLTFNLYSK